MSATIQTVLAFLIVLGAAAWLVFRAVAKRKSGCGGGDCHAVSPEVRRLQSRLKRNS